MGEKLFWIDFCCVNQRGIAPGVACLPLYAANFDEFAAAFVELDMLAFGFMCDWAFRWLPDAGGFDPHPNHAAKCAKGLRNVCSEVSPKAGAASRG